MPGITDHPDDFDREWAYRRGYAGAHQRRPEAGGGTRRFVWEAAQVDGHQHREALARREKGDETLMEIARSYAVSRSTISRL